MEKRGISQEVLKLIACVTMLTDHIGAVFFPNIMYLRVIGRIAFPIYCFLLVEGIHYTRSQLKYGIRLLIGLLLSEIPFDFGLFGGFTWQHQSVMVTLMIGYLCVIAIECVNNGAIKLLIAMAGFAVATFCKTDYAGNGVLLIILLSQTRGERWLQTVMLYAVALLMNSFRLTIAGYRIPIEVFAIFAMVPIACYSGKKLTHSKAVQWAFYLFYPVHLTCIWIARILLK